MKTSRDQLKAIVKECLVEILSEGMGSVSQVAESLQRPRSAQPKQATMQPMQRQQTNALKEAIKREAGGNRVMESILADTATRTLPSMLNAGDTQYGSQAGRSDVVGTPGAGVPQFAGTPEQAFGEEVASKWADLAFAESPKNRKSF